MGRVRALHGGGWIGLLQVIITHGGFHPLVWVCHSVIATTFSNVAGGRNEEGLKRLFHYVETELGKIMEKVQAPNILATQGWMENKGLSFHSRSSCPIWAIEKFWFWSISRWGSGTKTRQMSDTWREGNFFAHSFLKSRWLFRRNVYEECMDGLMCSLLFLPLWAEGSICYWAA